MTAELTTQLAAAAIAVPFLAALLGMLFGPRLPFGPAGTAVLGALATTGLVIAAALSGNFLGAGASTVYETGTRLTPTGTIPIVLGIRVDALSVTVAVMVALVSLAVQVFSVGYQRSGVRYSSYAALISLFTSAMLLVVLSADLLVIYVGWELMGLCSYLLIGHHWEERTTSAAAVKAFLMTRIADVGFLFGIFVLGAGAGSFLVSDVLAAVGDMSAGVLLTGTLLLVVGVVGKAAQFPLHSWLPDAMAGPAPVSALIHAATMVAAGAYFVARLYPVFLAAPASLAVLGVLAAISMLGAALAALVTDDLKRVLAYSTISQVALMFAALAIGNELLGIAHLLAHAAFKALLFLCAGAVIHVVGTNLMSGMGGLRRGMPITFTCMTVGFAALAGLPPTSGFFSKDAILASALHGGGSTVDLLVLLACLLTAVLTAAYATRAWLLTFFGRQVNTARVHEVPASMSVPLLALAVPAAFLGFTGLYFTELRPDLTGTLSSLGLLVAGMLGGLLMWRGRTAAANGRFGATLATAFHTDDLYERTIGRAVPALSGRVLRLDEELIASTVTGTGRGARLLGGRIRLAQNGNVQVYMTGVLAGVLLLAVGVSLGMAVL